ncbi:hypothetical protein FKM82_030324 [Ascaphus truei]
MIFRSMIAILCRMLFFAYRKDNSISASLNSILFTCPPLHTPITIYANQSLRGTELIVYKKPRFISPLHLAMILKAKTFVPN